MSPTAHVERPPLSYLLFGLEGGLEALPLRVSKTTTRDVRDRRDERDGPSGEDLWISNCAHQTTTSQFFISLSRGAAEAALDCAHRTSTFLSCAFCEQEGHLATPLPSSKLARYFFRDGG